MGKIKNYFMNKDYIECLGFKKNETTLFKEKEMMFNGSYSVYQLEKEQLIYFIEDLSEMYKGDGNRLIISVYNREIMGISQYPQHLFNGKIENKSELDLVLKMIGIFD